MEKEHNKKQHPDHNHDDHSNHVECVVLMSREEGLYE